MKKCDPVVDTAVFPVAGLGTRFLPITKAGPKEMLPIVDRPVIQYAVEEAVLAGIKHLIFITSSSKRAIEDYFDSNFELEQRLAEKKKTRALAMVQNILPSDVTISYVRQSAPLGLGHAIFCAQKLIQDKPFAVLLPDDVIDSEDQSCLQSMVAHYAATQNSVLAVQQVAPEDVDKYGIVGLEDYSKSFAKINEIVEKPKLAVAPSNFAVTGRYVLSPRIFEFLQNVQTGLGGEIQLTDAIAKLMQVEQVDAFAFTGKRYDCGSKLGLLQATLAFALRRADLRGPLLKHLKELVENTPAAT